MQSNNTPHIYSDHNHYHIWNTTVRNGKMLSIDPNKKITEMDNNNSDKNKANAISNRLEFLLNCDDISDESENDDGMKKEDMIHENLEMKTFINKHYYTYDWKERKWNEVNKTHSNERSIECPMSVAQIFSGGYVSKKLIQNNIIPRCTPNSSNPRSVPGVHES